MKKRWAALGVLALLGAGGYWAYQANSYRLPGLVQDWRDPVQPNHVVTWAAGPADAGRGTRGRPRRPAWNETAAEHHPDRRRRPGV